MFGSIVRAQSLLSWEFLLALRAGADRLMDSLFVLCTIEIRESASFGRVLSTMEELTLHNAFSSRNESPHSGQVDIVKSSYNEGGLC